jgi:hypothetical protein
MLEELRQAPGGAAVIATSLGEVVAFCQAAADQAAPASAEAEAG